MKNAVPEKPMIRALQGKTNKQFPFWFMRQAGRYLPEYRALRAKAGSFLDLCFHPKWAAEVTIQPLRRFDMDAAILFSDILVIPHALGMKVEFREGEGPHLDTSFTALSYDSSKLQSVFETLGLIKSQLEPHKTLIGFAGAPFTVACYMIDGKGGGFPKMREALVSNRGNVKNLINMITSATIDYLDQQIRSGADTVQLFDSWGAIPKGQDFDDFVITPAQKIVAALKIRHPDTPIIGFPRGAGDRYAEYAEKTEVSGMSVDQDTRLDAIQTRTTLQGNLAPETLLAGGDVLKDETNRILNAMKGKPFIFNLGHGIIKETPPEHVAELSAMIKAFDAS